MINNTSLKKFLKASIFPTFSLLNKIIRKNDRLVLLYNANGGVMFCNLPLRRYLLENHYDKKYNIVCGIESIEVCRRHARGVIRWRLKIDMGVSACKACVLYGRAIAHQAVQKSVRHPYVPWLGGHQGDGCQYEHQQWRRVFLHLYVIDVRPLYGNEHEGISVRKGEYRHCRRPDARRLAECGKASEV